MASFFEMVKTVYWLFPYGIDYPPTDKNEKKFCTRNDIIKRMSP